MNYNSLRQRRLVLLESICAVLLVPALLAWLVNLEMALKVVWPAWAARDRLLAAPAFDLFYRMAADLSTISTLVVVLLLFFPLMMARRARRYAAQDPERLRRLVYDPYPPHFPFFLVMLGLVGTLYGLLIGLTISGVSELGARAASSPDTIQNALDQLLDGTATALLSSLWGLVGAFVAARPVTWLFYWAAMLPGDEEPVMLTDTLRRLNHDLAELGETARGFQDRMGRTAIEDIPGALAALRESVDGLREDQRVARQAEGIRQEEAVRQAQEAAEQITTVLRDHTALLRDLSGHLEAQRNQLEDLAQAVKDGVRAQQQATEQRDRMCAALESEKEQRARERQSLRRALDAFIGPDH